jgi:hypothetical protein
MPILLNPEDWIGAELVNGRTRSCYAYEAPWTDPENPVRYFIVYKKEGGTE